MTAARIHKLEVSSVEIEALTIWAAALASTMKMLESSNRKTEMMSGLLSLLMILERAKKG